MQLMLKSNETRLLDIFKPDIVFLDMVYLAEGEQAVLRFLEDYGLEKEDVKEAGIKIMKNRIAIPQGTHATILECNGEELTLRVKDIEFDCILSFAADFVYVDIQAIDPEVENFFSKYDKKTPNSGDETELHGFYICDILEAVDAVYDFNNKRHAFEQLKYMQKSTIQRITKNMYLSKLRTAKRLHGSLVPIPDEVTSAEYRQLMTEIQKSK